MSEARLVIAAVTIEKRQVSEVAKSYGVARSWTCTLLDRYQAEGEAAFEPRSRRPKTSPGVSFGPPEKKLGIKGSPTRAVIFENARIPADRIIGAKGTGFKTALATLDHTVTGARSGRTTSPRGMRCFSTGSPVLPRTNRTSTAPTCPQT
jgi:hypothetical protein